MYRQSFGCFYSFSGTTFCMTQVFACHLYTSKRDCNIVKQCHHSSVRVWPLCAVVCSELFPNQLQLAVKKTHFNSEFIHGGGDLCLLLYCCCQMRWIWKRFRDILQGARICRDKTLLSRGNLSNIY